MKQLSPAIQMGDNDPCTPCILVENCKTYCGTKNMHLSDNPELYDDYRSTRSVERLESFAFLFFIFWIIVIAWVSN